MAVSRPRHPSPVTLAASAPALCGGALPAAAAGGLIDIRGALPAPCFPPFILTALWLLAGSLFLAVPWLRRRRACAGPPPAPPSGEGAAPGIVLERIARAFEAGDASTAELSLAVAAVARQALGSRTGLAAGRLTTAELLERAGSAKLLSEPELALACELLHFCDRVKFAGHIPGEGEALRALRLARSLAGEGRGGGA